MRNASSAWPSTSRASAACCRVRASASGSPMRRDVSTASRHAALSDSFTALFLLPVAAARLWASFIPRSPASSRASARALRADAKFSSSLGWPIFRSKDTASLASAKASLRCSCPRAVSASRGSSSSRFRICLMRACASVSKDMPSRHLEPSFRKSSTASTARRAAPSASPSLRSAAAACCTFGASSALSLDLRSSASSLCQSFSVFFFSS
mmetsp:Transcript_72244/g.186320  ORF Transcript_72244/g.186320 Transcript_72244/m.186320 type:complete len:211 (+) Transcript_72244:86-718(+)